MILYFNSLQEYGLRHQNVKFHSQDDKKYFGKIVWTNKAEKILSLNQNLEQKFYGIVYEA